MERTPNESTSALERLSERVRELERRVFALERRYTPAAGVSDGRPREELQQEEPVGVTAAAPGTSPAVAVPVATSIPSLSSALGLPANVSAGFVPVLGKAILGIAGAYLLRAAAESGALPGLTAVAATSLWAAVWLVSSATKRPGRDVVRAIYAPTAALIFFPMLWEATVQFKILSAVGAAVLLIAAVGAGSGLAWLRGGTLLVPLTALPAAATALILTVATGELIPFAIALLATCAAVEGWAVGEQWNSLRPWVALMADASIWLMIHVGGLPQQIETYKAVRPPTVAVLGLVLLGIYAASVGFRTSGLRKRITVFETAQLAAAFTLVLWATLRLAGAAPLVGVFCLAGAGVLYATVLLGFDVATSTRNHHVYGGFGLGLTIVGSALLLPSAAAAVAWAGLAVAAAFLAARSGHVTAAIHGAVLLLASCVFSGLLEYSWQTMAARATPAAPAAALWVVAMAAVLSYAACFRGQSRVWLRAFVAGLAALGVCSFVVAGIALGAGPLPVVWLPTLRTLVVCGFALTLGMAATRLPAAATGRRLEDTAPSPEGGGEGTAERARRSELVWISYAAVALVTIKLFYEDFHESPKAGLAISLLGYGGLLIFGPRLTRARSRAVQPETPAPSAQITKSADATR